MEKINEISIFNDWGGNNTTDRVGGIGVVMIYGSNFKILCEGFKDTTNNRMEMTAVLRAMKSVNRKTSHPIKIYADSAYVINCFVEGWYHKWKLNDWENSDGEPVKNKDLWESLIKEHNKFKDIEFCKVKGHVGIEYNELADLLATIAMARISHGLTNEDIIDIIENRDKKPKREFIAKYNLSAKQWNDFRKKGKNWIDLLKTHLY